MPNPHPEALLHDYYTDAIIGRVQHAHPWAHSDRASVNRGARYMAAKFIGYLETLEGMSALALIEARRQASGLDIRGVAETLPPPGSVVFPSPNEEKAHLGIAKALHDSAYASDRDEAGSRWQPGENISTSAGEPSEEAKYAAAKFMGRLESVNKRSYRAIETTASAADGKPVDPSEFGRMLGYMAMGDGISWFDDHAGFDLGVPSAEFHNGDHHIPLSMDKPSPAWPASPGAALPAQS